MNPVFPGRTRGKRLLRSKVQPCGAAGLLPATSPLKQRSSPSTLECSTQPRRSGGGAQPPSVWVLQAPVGWLVGALTVLHEGSRVPLVVLASVLVPHVGVVGLGVLVLDPSGGGGDGDYVKNNGEQQQQRQDPPAAGVGYPAAKHDRRPEFVDRDREEGVQGRAVRSARLGSSSASWRKGRIRGRGAYGQQIKENISTPVSNGTCFLT